MNKTTKKSLTAIALATAVASASTVNAEEVKPQLEQAQAEATLTPEVKAPTAEDVKAAVAKETAATDAIAAQKETVSNLEVEKASSDTAVTEATETVEDAKAILKETSPETIAQAETDVETQKETLKEKDQALTTATETATDAAKALEEAKAQEEAAKSEVESKEARALEAEAKVNDAKPVDTTPLAQAVATATDAETAASEEVKTALANYDKAVEANKDKATAVDMATKAIESAKTELATADKDAMDAAMKATTAQQEVTAVSATIQNQVARKDILDQIRGIFAGEERKGEEGPYEMKGTYKESLRALWSEQFGKDDYTGNDFRLTDDERQNHEWLLQERGTHFATLINELVATEADADEIVNPYDLTDNQLRSLNKFTLLVVNAMRSGAGFAEFSYQDNVAVEATRALSKAQSQHFINVYNAQTANGGRYTGGGALHMDENDVNKALEITPGVRHLTNNIGFSAGLVYDKSMAMSQFKQATIGALRKMLFDDHVQKWNHANPLISVGSVKDNALVLIPATVANNLFRGTAYFYLSIPQTSPYRETASIYNTASETASVNDKLNRIAEAQTVVTKAQADQAEAEGRARTAKAKLDQAENHLKTLTQGDAGLETAAQTLAEKKAALKEAQDAVKDAKANLAQALDANAKSQEALKGAQAELDQAKADLDTAKASHAEKAQVLKEATETANMATKALENAKSAQAQATKTLAEKEERAYALKNAPTYLEKAEHNLALAKKEAARILEELDAANTVLKDLTAKGQESTAERERVENLYKEHQEAIKKVEAERLALKEARIKTSSTGQGVTAKADYNLTYTLPEATIEDVKKAENSVKVPVTYTAKPASTPSAKTAQTKVTPISDLGQLSQSVKAKKESTLPKTGQVTNVTFVALGMLGLMTAAVSRKKQ